MQTEKPNLYRYLDYRKFLGHYYQWNKHRDPAFSLRYFSQQAGLKSFSYLKLVIDGERKLTPTFFEPFCRALKLSAHERAYFQKSIDYTHETHSETQSRLLSELLALRPQADVHVVDHRKLHLCQEWYYIPLIELTQVEEFVYDTKWISERLQLSVATVKRAIQDLIRGDYLEEKAGSLVKVNRIADTPNDVTDMVLQKYHSQNLMIASRKIFEQSVAEREYGSITFSVNAAKFDRLKAKMKEFRREVFSILDEPDVTGSEIFQLNMQLFRLSQPQRPLKPSRSAK